MKQNELRVGNIISKRYNQFDEECKDYIQGICDVEDIAHYHFMQSNYKPVELTEKWLIRLDFNKSNGAFFKCHPFYVKYLDCIPEGFWLLRDMGVPIRLLKYVHQLQNLYLDLMDENLILK